jgi:hypothetical protein
MTTCSVHGRRTVGNDIMCLSRDVMCTSDFDDGRMSSFIIHSMGVERKIYQVLKKASLHRTYQHIMQHRFYEFNPGKHENCPYWKSNHCTDECWKP